MNKYSWSNGAVIRIAPEIVGEEIEKILEDNNGQITPATVLDTARNVASPLHDYFEWNNKTAAEKYRLEQAGYLLRHLRMEIMIDSRPIIIPAIPNIRTDSRAGYYMSIVSIMQDEDQRKIYLKTALKELDAWRRKYAILTELESVFAVIADLEKIITA